MGLFTGAAAGAINQAVASGVTLPQQTVNPNTVASPQAGSLQSLFPNLDLSRVTDPNYMLQFYNPDEGSGDRYILTGADGKQYGLNANISPDASQGGSINVTNHYGAGDTGGGIYGEYGRDGNLLNSRSYMNDPNGVRDFITMGAMMLGPLAAGGAFGAAAAGAGGGAEAGAAAAGGIAPSMPIVAADVGAGAGVGAGVTVGEAGAGLGAAGAAGGAGGGSGASPYVFNPAMDSQAANVAIDSQGGNALAGYGSSFGLPSGSPVPGGYYMPNGGTWQDSLIKAGMNGVGGYLNDKAASGAASNAASGAQFRPVGVTSRFGGSNFQVDGNGNLVSAGYTMDPYTAMLRDTMLSHANQNIGIADQARGAGQSMFNLGSQYLAKSPDEAAQQWMDSQQKVLQPGRERAMSDLQSRLFATGRMGLATGGTSTQAASNPELQAYYNSIAQQDAGLASQAQEQGRAGVNFGAGLFNSGVKIANDGYAPFQTALGNAATIEGYGQDTLNMGAQLGGRSAQAGSSAAPWQYKANASSPAGSFFSGMGSSSSPLNYQNLQSGYEALRGLWT